jgi:hypothetical protein
VLIYINNTEEHNMHTDESKKFDKRNIERNIKDGVISQKDYEIFLSKLPDISDKLFNPEGSPADSTIFELKIDSEKQSKKIGIKKRAKKKGK